MQYRTELVDKKMVAHETMAFRFKKPDGFLFRSGQTIDVTLIDPSETDEKGNTRAFSIISTSKDSDLAIATRLRDSSFKRTLRNLEIGSEVEIAGPFGSFTLHQNESRPAVFLVGGVGVTPFLSIIKDASERSLPHRMTLLYSNHRPEDALFLDELRELEKRTKNFVFVPTMTDLEQLSGSWSGAVGRITREMIEMYVPDRENAIYYSAGPEQMVSAMQKVLTEMGISEDDMRTEEFSGY